MTTAPSASAAAAAAAAPSGGASAPVGPPARFASGLERNRRIGRTLRLMARIEGEDDALLARIARAMRERDEPGARLAKAMRLRAGDPGRITMAQVQQALREGVGSVADAPPALVELLSPLEQDPAWLDRDLLEQGGRVMRALGSNAQDVLLQLSLVGGYRFAGPTDLLVATGGLTGGTTRRRLAETQHWGAIIGRAGALVPPAPGRPAGEGWRLTAHVRVMHALVNHAFESDPARWDVEQWGLPINQADQASTLGLFDGVLLLGVRGLGVPVSRADARAVMHLWRYVGWLLGVDDDFLVDSERERHRINYHLLLAQAPLSEAGRQLAQAVVGMQAERRRPRLPAALQPLWTRFERERLLSMLTVFLGPRSMRELGLGVRPPWAHAYLVPLNTLRYRLLDRLPGGRARRIAWGEARADHLLATYFAGEEQDVARLPA